MPQVIEGREMERSFNPCSTNDITSFIRVGGKTKLGLAREWARSRSVYEESLKRRLCAVVHSTVWPSRSVADAPVRATPSRTWFSGMKVSSFEQYQPECSPK